jgi:rRNA maturation protein Nop10
MPDQLYRRCPACRESAPVTPCPTCGGERYIPARFDGTGHRRWRLRISTLMLLVVIAGLASYIVADLRHRAEDARRLALERHRAVVEAHLAEVERAYALAEVQQARASVAQPQAKEAPTPASTGPTR